MPIDLPKEVKADAIASIERYFKANMDEPIGSLAAGELLGFILEEIGPSIYNKAVSDAQSNLQSRIMELDIDVHEAEFQYWRKAEQRKRR